ncbi:tetratricopeptide repeat protein [Sphingomonas koreensis]
MADPFTLANIAASCVWGLITGPFGNRADAAAAAGARKLAETLSGTQSPANHDVLRATHSAWLKSVQVVARLAESSTVSWDDRRVHKKLAAAVHSDALKELGFGAGAFPQAELGRVIEAIYGEGADPQRGATEATIAQVEAAMDEPLTEALKRVFRDGHAGKPGWAVTFQLFFAQAVKGQDEVFRILTFERLNEAAAFAEGNAAALAEVERTLADSRAEMRSQFDEVKAAQAEQTALLQQIAANQGNGEQASLELLRSMADRYAEQHDSPDPEDLKSYLLAKIDQWREYREQIELLEAEGNRDAMLLADAKEEADGGDFAAADALLAEAAEALDEKIAPLLIAKSARIALRAENARLAGNHAAAMRFHDEAVAVLPARARKERIERLWAAARTQSEWGERFGDPGLLPDAIRRWQALVKMCPRDRSPVRWGMAQNSLGNALRKLGEREHGTARLEAAVAAYRLALEERTRDQAPIRWARTQNNLANALTTIGRRELGTDHLEEAVVAYRLALEEFVREQVPFEWAATQNNLGNALSMLGTRLRSTASLELATVVYRLALEERTRERVPLQWATTQNNLGNALSALGRAQDDPALLGEAIACYRLALAERIRERVPLDWAMTQHNLGNSLRSLGERSQGTAYLEEAVIAYRAALEERTRERMPLDWGSTVMTLCLALAQIHERGGEAVDLAALRADAEAARATLAEGGHAYWTPRARQVIEEIDRIARSDRD